MTGAATFTQMERLVDSARLRRLHQQRMERAAAAGEWAAHRDSEYDEEVVERAASYLRGDGPEPFALAEHFGESGACSECDAALLLELYEEEQ